MIDRRDMLKLVVVGVMGAVVAGSSLTRQEQPAARDESMRFSIEGDLGAIRAAANGESIQVSGDFAERAIFTLG